MFLEFGILETEQTSGEGGSSLAASLPPAGSQAGKAGKAVGVARMFE